MREVANHPIGDVVVGVALPATVGQHTAHRSRTAAQSAAGQAHDDRTVHDAIAREPLEYSRLAGRAAEQGPGVAYPACGPLITGDVIHISSARGHAKLADDDASGLDPLTKPLRQAQLRVEQLISTNRRKDELLAVVSHELRSPLAAIRNCVFVLRQSGGNPAQQRAQAVIERQVGRMTQLIEDLLDVSRISQGRQHLQRERIDLRVVLSHAIETLDADINERCQQLITALPDTPVWLRADAQRLEQVFVNLLANASKYTDRNGVLTVRAQVREAQAVVCIRDSGIGIPPESLPHIFELFRQADEAVPRSRSGLGIGLAVVRNLVQMHGGTVTAASAGRYLGSEFTVRLPREGR